MKWNWSKFFASYMQFSNMFAHMWAGQWATLIACKATGSYYALFTGLAVGILMEIYQYFFMDNKELKLEDRVADSSQWGIGGASVWLIDFIIRIM